MNNLFSALMEEAERVNNLETEVSKVLEERKAEQDNWRNEKRTEIGAFLADIEDAFRSFKLENNNRYYITDVIQWNADIIELVFLDGNLRFEFTWGGGFFYVGRDHVSQVTYLEEYASNSIRAHELFRVLTDEWNAEIEQKIIERTQTFLKDQLARRVKNMTMKLKKANDWREQKIGGAK